MNLLEETKEILKRNRKSLDDIEWFGTKTFQIPMTQFIELFDVNYDDGFGTNEIPSELLVVGSDFWLERHEYDGSEWWEYKTLPLTPNHVKTNLKTIKRESFY